MRKSIIIYCLLMILTGLVSACAPVSLQTTSNLMSWIDAPLDGSTIPLAPYQIVAHGSDSDPITALEITINGDLFHVIDNPNPEGLLFTAYQDWTPPAAGDYQIQTRSMDSSNNWSSAAIVRVTVEEGYTPPEILELLPTVTPDLELSTCEPALTAAMNTTCRTGPSTFHEATAYLIEGDQAPIVARNLDSTWWAVQLETEAQPCWISDQTSDAVCVTDEIEYLESPPSITRIFPSNQEFYWGDNPLKTITIKAQVAGETPVAKVRFIYHLEGKSQWYNLTMFTTAAEIWQVDFNARSIDGYENVNSAVIEYYLEATNEAGLITNSPLLNNIKLKKVP